MENLEVIIKLIGYILVAIGVVFVFDARKITKNRFSFGDRNEGAKVLKVAGFVVSIIGVVIILFQNIK